MKPENVPDELVERAAKARFELDYPGKKWEYLDPELTAEYRQSARIILAAVLPAHEVMVRAKVAEEIDRVADEMGDGSSWDTGMAMAMRIARGET